MRYFHKFLCVVTGLFVSPVFLHGQYQVPISVFGNGGTGLSGDNYHMMGTLGQTLQGDMSSSNHVTGVGFWYSRCCFAVTGIDARQVLLPEVYALHQNYPNPFNPRSTISYDLPEMSEVTIMVYDIMGREKIRIFDGVQEPGFHKVIFESSQLSSGVYFYRMKAKSVKTGEMFSKVMKAMYIK